VTFISPRNGSNTLRSTVATNDALDDAGDRLALGKIDRVLWFSHSSSLGGAELGLHEAVSALRRRGVESIVVVPNDGPLVARLRDDGLAVLVQPYRWWVSLGPSRDGRLKNILAIFDIRRIRRLAALIKSTGADAVVTNTITIGLPALAARSAGVGNIWYVREYGRDDHSLEFDVGDRLAYWLIDRLSSAVIVNSLALQAHLLEHGISRAELVSYAVDVPDGYAQPPPSGETLQLVLVGAVKPGKGHEDAVRALAGVLEQGTRARLTFVGPALSTFGDAISKLAVDLGVQEHIRFTGFLDNPFPEIAAADICLVCSRREAFGRATVEAMKCARAVVGAASGATAELIEDEVTGLLYEPGDVGGLRDAITRLDRDRDLLARLGENARIWASGHFTAERYAEDLELVVVRVCGETRAANASRRRASLEQPSHERPR
jgi:glycosyltransferase involved in cell wall biosynthesis